MADPFQDYLNSPVDGGGASAPPPSGGNPPSSFQDWLNSPVDNGGGQNAPLANYNLKDAAGMGQAGASVGSGVGTSPFSQATAQVQSPFAQNIPASSVAPTSQTTPIADAMRQSGFGDRNNLLSAGQAVVGDIGNALNQFGAKTTGSEVTAVPLGQMLRNIPGIGVGEVAAEAASPQVKDYLQNTALRDTPGLGLGVRAIETAANVLGATGRVTQPVRGAIENVLQPLTDAEQQNPILKPLLQQNPVTNLVDQFAKPIDYSKIGATPGEINNLSLGFINGTLNPDQTARFETLTKRVDEQYAGANPAQAFVLAVATDPLSYGDGLGIFDHIGKLQALKNSWEAGLDLGKVGEAVAQQPLIDRILLSTVARPRQAEEGALLSEKALGMTQSADNNIARRLVAPFTNSPMAKIAGTLQRATDNLGQILSDGSRSFGDKVNLLTKMRDAAQSKDLSGLEPFFGKGVTNSPDFQRAIYGATDYTPSKFLTDDYQRARQVYENLSQAMQTSNPVYNDMGGSFVSGEAKALGGGYENIFNNALDQWKKGAIDLRELDQQIESIAGARMLNEYYDHAAGQFAKAANQPNLVTNFINKMKNYEGLLYVNNPLTIANNIVNNLSTTTRYGINMTQSGEDMAKYFERFGFKPDKSLYAGVQKALGEKLVGEASAYGTRVPEWSRNIPGLKQLRQANEFMENRSRQQVLAQTMERFMGNNFKYGEHIPNLPPRVSQYFQDAHGADVFDKIVSELEHARNSIEGEKALLGGTKTYASYLKDMAASVSRDVSKAAGRDITITPDILKDAIPLETRAQMARVLDEALQRSANGEDFTAAYNSARANEQARFAASLPQEPLFPDAQAQVAQAKEAATNIAPTPSDTVGSVPMMITRDMERRLRVLGYDDAAINKMTPQEAQDVLRAGTKPTPPEAPAAVPTEPTPPPTSPIIDQIRTQAQGTAPTKIDAPLIRQWNALLHEGESEGVQRATQNAINKMTPEKLQQEAASIVERARAKGQTWVDELAQMYEERAHYLIDQMKAGNPKYNTPEFQQRIANGDALVKMLRGGENGFDWTRLDQPYDYRPYETFDQFRKRITAEPPAAGEPSAVSGEPTIGAAESGTPSVDTAGAGAGSAPSPSETTGATGTTNDVGNPSTPVERYAKVLKDATNAGGASVLNEPLNAEAHSAMTDMLMNALHDAVKGDTTQAAGVLPPDVEKLARQWLKDEFNPALVNAKQSAIGTARKLQEQTVLNYETGRYNIDDTLLLGAPFTFWWLHTLGNYTREFIDHPALLAYFVKARQMIDQQSQGMPARFAHKIQLPMPFGGALGDGVWVDPMRALYPAGDVFQVNDWQRPQQDPTNPDGSTDYNGVFSDLFGIHKPYQLAWALLNGHGPEELQNTVASLPIAKFARGLTSFVTPGGVGLDTKYDQFYYERAAKELTADGTLTADDAKQAILSHKGTAWDAIRSRAGIENYGIPSVTGALGMRGTPFTQGEAKYREAQVSRENLLNQAVQQLGGNPNMTTDQRYQFLTSKGFYKSQAYQDFSQQNPELDTGSLIGKGYDANGNALPPAQADEARLRTYLIQKINDGYYNAPDLRQKIIAAQLGDAFTTQFRNSDTKNYDNIPTKTLLGWTNAIGATIPQTASFDQPTPDPEKITFTTDKQNAAYQKFYDNVAQSIGWAKVGALEKEYFALTDKAQKAAFRNTPDGKALQAYWDTRTQMWKDNPDIVKLLEQVGLKSPDTTTTASAPADPRGAALSQAVSAAGLDWNEIKKEQAEEKALPLGTGQRTAYLAAHPVLARYFQISGAIYGNTAPTYGSSNSGYQKQPDTYRYSLKPFNRPGYQKILGYFHTGSYWAAGKADFSQNKQTPQLNTPKRITAGIGG